ncbi:CHAT domain-containing protein, partial [Brasilonema octagenarum]
MWRIGNWLRNLAIQLREALNLTPQPPSLVGRGENSKPLKKQEEEWKRGLQSLGEEELQEYFQFLEEVLRVTAESEGDAQVVYPLLVENTQYLNLNLAEVLRRWMTNKLAEVETDEAQSFAVDIFNFSNRIQEFPLGDKASNMEIAIAGYEVVSTVFTRQSFPQDWATTQNNLAAAYRNRIHGEKAENLERAIASYTAALEVRTRESFPQDWAMTQNNLATAYRNRIHGEKAENLESAIASYTAALEVLTRQSFPQDWAMTQNNLGLAYWNRIHGEKAENLESAIASYSAALEVRTRESFPQNHAETAFNLGLAYIDAERFADAYNIFQSAIDAVEFLRGEIVSGDEIKQKHAEEWNSLYRQMVEVCLELGYDDQAVEYIERSKTRNLVEVIASQKRSQPLQELDKKIAEEKRRLETVENPDTTNLNELRQQREELIGQVIPLKHIRFAQIQELVDERTAILQWYIFDDCFRVFIITRNNQQPIIWQSSPQDVEDLQNWKDEYLKTYTTKKPLWRYQLATKLSKLAEILHINDILNLIPSSCQALILVPHRYLHLLPLHALRVSGEGESYLLDKFSGGVRYAPSCQLLKLATSGNPSLLPTQKSFPLLTKERDARQGRVR